MIEGHTSSLIRKKAISLVVLPKFLDRLRSALPSLNGRLLLPFAFVSFFSQRSEIGRIFFLDKRAWIEKTYDPEDLAPFYPNTGDFPVSHLTGSLQTLVSYAKVHLGTGQGQSLSSVRFWMDQREIPPAIVIQPPPPQVPFSKAKGYLIDGNHRAIAMALRGEKIRCYCGIATQDIVRHKIKYAHKFQRDSSAKTYDAYVSNSSESLITSSEAKLISEKIGKKMATSNLDVATGSGRIISKLEKNVDISIGLDTSKAMMSLARKRTECSSFVTGDSGSLPFKSGLFDSVTCFRLFINLKAEDRQKFLRECKRVMSRDGTLIIDNHCNKMSLTGFLGDARSRLSNDIDNPFKLYSLLTDFEFKSELRSAGFILQERMYSFLPSLSRLPISSSIQQQFDRCLTQISVIRPFADLIVIAGCSE